MPDIPIQWDFFPFMPQVMNVAGGVMAVVLILCVIALAIGAVLLAFAKIVMSGPLAQITVGVCIWVLVGAAIVGAAVGLVGWASGALVW